MKAPAERSWVRAALGYGGAALIAVFVLAWSLRLGTADLREPFAYQSDALHCQILIKSTVETGWFLANNRLGAPFGMTGYDFPLPESLHYLGVKLLGLFTGNSSLIINLIFLLGFPLVTVSSLWVCRRLRLSWGPAIVVSLLYAFLPYHFRRGVAHFWLATYYTVPLLILLTLWACSTEPLLFDPQSPGWKPRWRLDRRRALTAVVICIVGGSTGIYYAFFTCALLCLGAIASSLARRRWGSLWTALALIALLATTSVLNLAPNFLYWAHAGRNSEVAARGPGESEMYGLKLTQLVMPETGHRLAPMRALRERYDCHSQLRNENSDVLGSVGSLGFFALLGWLLVRRRDQDESIETRLAHLNFFAVLIGTVGGLGALFAFTVSPQIRGYNRISIFIAFLALLMVALVLERVMKRLALRRHVRWFAWAGLMALLVLGLLDEIPPGRAPSYARAAAEHQNDVEFFGAAEARHTPGAMVFQLPYRPFPESPPTHASYDYDLARPFLTTRAMRWSYGAIRGRFGDRTIAKISEEPLPEMLESLVLLGYEAMAIDRDGYLDHGAKLEASLAGFIGAPEGVNRNQRFSMFDLRGFATALRARLGDAAWQARARQTMTPVLCGLGQGCWPTETGIESTWRWCDREAELQIDNHADHPRKLRLTFDVATGHPEMAKLTFSGALLSDQVSVSSLPTRVERTMTVPPGAHVIHLQTDAQRVVARSDSRHLYLRIEHLHVTEIE